MGGGGGAVKTPVIGVQARGGGGGEEDKGRRSGYGGHECLELFIRDRDDLINNQLINYYNYLENRLCDDQSIII